MSPRGSVVAIVLVWMCAVSLSADDWPAPAVQNVFSDNGRYFVRVVPGRSVGDTVGFAGSQKGPHARGEFYAKQPDLSYQLVADVALQNPVSPVEALVTNNGYLVTFDNWHNVGYGTIVAIYAPGGRFVRGFTAEQLYSRERLAKIPRSTSSRWWRCFPHGYVDPDGQTTVYVFERFGGTFTFKVADGAFEHHPGQAECSPPKGPFSLSWVGQ